MIPKNPLRRCLRSGAVLAASALLALSGCTGGGGGEEAVSEDQVALNELSDRLVAAESHSYTAEYLVEGSTDSVLVAVDPEAGTAAVVIGDRPQLWQGEDDAELGLWLRQQLEGLLPAESEIASWLSATATDPTATSVFSDTTLAGELADCVDVQGAQDSPVGSYEVCVTTVGVIASITAKVDGLAYTAKLVNYHDGVDTAWLDGITGRASTDNQ